MKELVFPLRRPSGPLVSRTMWVGIAIAIAGGFPLILWMTPVQSTAGVIAFGTLWVACVAAGPAYIVFVSDRAKKAHVIVGELDFTLQSRRWFTNIRLTLADITEVRETSVTIRDGFRRLWPLDDLAIFDILDMEGRAVSIRVRRGIGLPVGARSWWPLGRWRTLVIDPEDPLAFATALRQRAPHVTIDASLLE